MIQITLRAARINSNMSLSEVAKVLKKSKQTVINWEKGRTAIDLANFERLSELYNIPRENILLPENLPYVQVESEHPSA